MPRVSVKTLVLMVLLLVSVLTHQWVSWTPAAHADVFWLAGDDPNEPSEPVPEVANATFGSSDDDPNEPSEPVPEIAAAVGRSFMDNDPNEPSEPVPEIAVAVGRSSMDNDPNEPSEPVPEVA